MNKREYSDTEEVGNESTLVVKKQHLNQNLAIYPDATDPQTDDNRNNILLANFMSLIPGKEQTLKILEKSETVIGRSRSCDIILDEVDISTKHCKLVLLEMPLGNENRKLLNIIDTSRNGTYINGNKLVKKDYVLKNGDRVIFGKKCSFLFKYASESPIVAVNSVHANNDDVNLDVENTDDGKFKKPQFGFTSSQQLKRKPQQKSKVLSVFDKYIVGKELGSGHYAIVKEGINKQTGKSVAIKIFHPQLNDDQKKNHQFREETDILMRVQHKNIVNLLDSFVEPISKMQIQKYLVLDKIDDGELFDRIVRKTNLSQPETKALFKQILSGLKYLHGKNIIHRDIKPENILLNVRRRQSPDEIQTGPWDDDEIDIQVKIADFGLAKFTGEMQFTNTLCGTPSYVAPEILTKQGHSSKVDVWSAGVLLYVCLCGFPPFSDQLGPPSLKDQILQGKFAFYSPYWDDIDDTVLHLISNLLVVNPVQRFSIEHCINHPWFNDIRENSFSSRMKRLQISDKQKLPKTYSELSKL
ncbi:hypothetical protein TPHA_0C04570 [Tetrapisispora phaffii CBS 4417]|uniref:DNA damage response protein kinase DUN1 n=1 Tax=Tetrapisispora phaffii (strain ATCC 24235 / CBS 4417 / NBRC 1672 / NRRL Y-8282 / UCD 70-5) TaxID=1071381 RepID=G8BQU5_TETPH|nr:hypothetical protein TPHA_0C04570 [Tetrapisispora phaffii CBS 4417]CCE62607.1 hypothetical protein TPHA_0C04570 [Tetrapisispora phaffii CBS 4417]